MFLGQREPLGQPLAKQPVKHLRTIALVGGELLVLVWGHDVAVLAGRGDVLQQGGEILTRGGRDRAVVEVPRPPGRSLDERHQHLPRHVAADDGQVGRKALHRRQPAPKRNGRAVEVRREQDLYALLIHLRLAAKEHGSSWCALAA